MRKYSTKEVAEIVQRKGLGYAISSYLGYSRIEDKELSALWKQCELGIQNIDWEPYYESMKKIEDKLRGYND